MVAGSSQSAATSMYYYAVNHHYFGMSIALHVTENRGNDNKVVIGARTTLFIDNEWLAPKLRR